MSTATADIPEIVPKSPMGDEILYEIIDGLIVEMPPMSAYAMRIANRLANRINQFADPQDLGEAVVEVLFRLPLDKIRNRRPDVAFVSFERWQKTRPMVEGANAWDVVPNLSVEVVSPNDLVEELFGKSTSTFEPA